MPKFCQIEQDWTNVNSGDQKEKKKYEQYNRLIEWLTPQLPYYKIESIGPYKENPNFLLIIFSPDVPRDNQLHQTDNYNDDDDYEDGCEKEKLNLELLIKPTDYAEQKELTPKLMYKGGISRNRLCQEIHNKELHISDIDLVYLVGRNDSFKSTRNYPRDEWPEIIAKARNKIPATLGRADIDVINFSEYFNSRDFTINETALSLNGLICTPKAYKDMKDKIIRPSNNEIGAWWDAYGNARLRSRIITRSLKFLMEFLHELSKESKIEEIGDWEFDPDQVFPVDIAKLLDDGFARGEEIGEMVYTELVKRGLINPQIAANSRDLTTILRWMMKRKEQKPFKFKHAPHRHLDK